MTSIYAACEGHGAVRADFGCGQIGKVSPDLRDFMLSELTEWIGGFGEPPYGARRIIFREGARVNAFPGVCQDRNAAPYAGRVPPTL